MGEKVGGIVNMLLALVAFGIVAYFIGETYFPEVTSSILANTKETFTSGMGFSFGG